jgi:predicted RecB family nuclease
MLEKAITSEVFVAYSQCPRKAFLLLFSDNQGTPHDYHRILEERRKANQAQYLESFNQMHEDARPYDEKNLRKGEVFVEATLKAECWQAYCDVLTKVAQDTSSRKIMYEPIIAVGTYSITKEQKTELLFIGKVLGQIQKQLPTVGTIAGMDGKAHRVKLESGYKAITPFLKTLQVWMEEKPAEPPALILNKHCPSCQFRDLCREQAVKENNLSLLDRMTPKAIQKYSKKGIFTVLQLSYLFKPRRSRKRKAKAPIKHSLELQALAIREQKIYIQELPKLTRKPVELFLDIEGLPDQDFHYLIGLLVCDGKNNLYYPFWANTTNDEKEIWGQLIKKLNEYSEAPIYHYGSYEVRAINELAKRYSTESESVKKRLINLTSYIYGKIYFPTYSNSLKTIGDFIGISWEAKNASGLQSLVWRYKWEDSQDSKYQQMLIRYNQDDCNALIQLAEEFCKITVNSELQSNIDFADRPKKISTESGKQIHDQLDTILKFAHSDYEKTKISIHKDNSNGNNQIRKIGAKKRHTNHDRLSLPKANRVIDMPILKICSRCNTELTEKQSDRIIERISVDIAFLRDGCKKRIDKYIGYKKYCPICKKYCFPPTFPKQTSHFSFGHGFKVWVVYQRLFLRLPYQAIEQQTEDLFCESVSPGSIANFIKYFSEYYAEAEQILIQKILESPFVHADETQINIRGINQYVWVFTDGIHVVFKLTKTRDSQIVHELLSGYNGVLISDFYGGYDSVNCKQQKCWVHLIRDLNDDLWKMPFDTEFESFVSEVRNLIVPILEAVEQYGLKKRHLNKFKKNVEQFYSRTITEKVYQSELVITYQKRFERYKHSLFTFLEQDAIPWHNNTAENAIRHLAVQRKISGSFFESGATAYLVLLGIMKTCKFQDKSFLNFLISKEKDIDQFKSPKRRKSTKSVETATNLID